MAGASCEKWTRVVGFLAYRMKMANQSQCICEQRMSCFAYCLSCLLYFFCISRQLESAAGGIPRPRFDILSPYRPVSFFIYCHGSFFGVSGPGDVRMISIIIIIIIILFHLTLFLSSCSSFFFCAGSRPSSVLRRPWSFQLSPESLFTFCFLFFFFLPTPIFCACVLVREREEEKRRKKKKKMMKKKRLKVVVSFAAVSSPFAEEEVEEEEKNKPIRFEWWRTWWRGAREKKQWQRRNSVARFWKKKNAGPKNKMCRSFSLKGR